jgi:hypothetical protein
MELTRGDEIVVTFLDNPTTLRGVIYKNSRYKWDANYAQGIL